MQKSVENDRLQAEFPTISNHLDEDSKLKTTTVFDGLRTVSNLFAKADSPIYLGGLFSYDLVANFIPMENISLQDDGLACPDYSFYLAEQLITIDHQTKKSLFTNLLF